jgi:hypothetical protein
MAGKGWQETKDALVLYGWQKCLWAQSEHNTKGKRKTRGRTSIKGREMKRWEVMKKRHHHVYISEFEKLSLRAYLTP